MDKRDRNDTRPETGRQSDERARRLADSLRANLQKRKLQARARRNGAADERPAGLGAADAGGTDEE